MRATRAPIIAGVSTGSRIQREAADIDDELRRIVSAIDYGNGDLQQIRAVLERIRRDELPEIDRLARQVKRGDTA